MDKVRPKTMILWGGWKNGRAQILQQMEKQCPIEGERERRREKRGERRGERGESNFN